MKKQVIWAGYINSHVLYSVSIESDDESRKCVVESVRNKEHTPVTDDKIIARVLSVAVCDVTKKAPK